MKKLKIDRAIIVEGKYDKIKLSSLIDAVIICTNGFGIYKDKDKTDLIRHYAQTKGIVILTDSDSAGFKIRNHIKSIVPQGSIINLYIPEIFGKERRKSSPSKEGKLGVEGINISVLRDIFEKSGILVDNIDEKSQITKAEFYELGLSGKPYSSQMRRRVCEKLSIPQHLTSKALLEYINNSVDTSDFYDIIGEIISEIS